MAKHHFQVRANKLLVFVVTLSHYKISIQDPRGPLWGVHTCTWSLRAGTLSTTQAPLKLEIYQILEARGNLSTIGHRNSLASQAVLTPTHTRGAVWQSHVITTEGDGAEDGATNGGT